MKKKVVFIINNLTGGGAERVISIISDYLVNHGYDVTILMLRGDKCVYKINSKVKRIIRYDYEPHDALKQIRYLRKYYKAHPDAIFVSFLRSQNLYSLIAAVGTKAKIVFSERMTPVKFSFKNFKNSAEFKLLMFFAHTNRCKKIVFQSKSAADGYPKTLKKKGIVIPNPLNDNMPQPYSGERKKNIVAVGRLSYQKNYKLLIDAFAKFSKINPGYTLQIYGKGALQSKLQNYTEKLGLKEKVELCGFCSDVHEKIVDAGMYVMSSDYEGLSNALLEAMALGIPTISTDHPPGSAKEYIKNYDNGILIPVRDTEALFGAMCYISNNTDKADEMGKRASEIRNAISSSVIGEKWKSLFETL